MAFSMAEMLSMASPREHDMGVQGSVDKREAGRGVRALAHDKVHQAAELMQAPSMVHMHDTTNAYVGSSTKSCTAQALRASSLLCPHAATHIATTLPHRQGKTMKQQRT